MKRLKRDLRYLRECFVRVESTVTDCTSVPDLWQARQALETLGSALARLTYSVGMTEAEMVRKDAEALAYAALSKEIDNHKRPECPNCGAFTVRPAGDGRRGLLECWTCDDCWQTKESV